MALDDSTCYRAIAARDPRFDGRFFTGVLTTGIYCRPVCPARTPRRENVRFFSCAAAAEKEGFRACRRCRPDAAPGTPAWAGTSATVARALRLISAGALDEQPVDTLSAQLGVGERHLRRLFRHELGASPAEIAATRRVHFARNLLFETELPVATIAFSSGFGSIRRFNEAFREGFGCTPVEYRKGRADRATGFESPLSLKLPYQPPYRWKEISDFLAPRAVPGVESLENGVYRRSFFDGRISGVLEIEPISGENALELRVPAVGSSELLMIAALARRLFDVDADVATISAHLSRDSVLAGEVRRAPGIRVPGCWDPFEVAVRAILGQQITVAAATTLAGRLVRELGTALSSPSGTVTHLFPAPPAVASADVSRLGIPRKRAEAVSAFAGAVARGEIDWSAGLDAFVQRLTAIPGIGAWTAQYVAMRALAEPDAFPSGDLWLRRLIVPGRTLSEKGVEDASRAWRPWRAYAAFYLWRSAAGRKKESRWKSRN